MKTKSSLESAFFNPRALVGFGFGTIGLLLGLVAFFALPKHSAWAIPSSCTNVVFTESSGPVRDSVYVSMESHNEGTTTQCTIYYNVDSVPPLTPNHESTIYTGPYLVFDGQIRFFKAFAHQSAAIPEDSSVTNWYSAP